MGSVTFILEEKLNVIFLFLMNLNKKKICWFLSVMNIIRNTWVCLVQENLSRGQIPLRVILWGLSHQKQEIVSNIHLSSPFHHLSVFFDQVVKVDLFCFYSWTLPDQLCMIQNNPLYIIPGLTAAEIGWFSSSHFKTAF